MSTFPWLIRDQKHNSKHIFARNDIATTIGKLQMANTYKLTCNTTLFHQIIHATQWISVSGSGTLLQEIPVKINTESNVIVHL